MNRMIKLFQQKSNRKFDEYLLAKRKSLGEPGVPQPWPGVQDVAVAVLKTESDIWAKAAELLRSEELNRK